MCFYTLKLFPVFGMEPKQFSNFAIYSKARAEFRCGANRKVSVAGRFKDTGQEWWSREGLLPKCKFQFWASETEEPKRQEMPQQWEAKTREGTPQLLKRENKNTQGKKHLLLLGRRQVATRGSS